jgi:hypothetical protein
VPVAVAVPVPVPVPVLVVVWLRTHFSLAQHGGDEPASDDGTCIRPSIQYSPNDGSGSGDGGGGSGGGDGGGGGMHGKSQLMKRREETLERQTRGGRGRGNLTQV